MNESMQYRLKSVKNPIKVLNIYLYLRIKVLCKFKEKTDFIIIIRC